MFTICVYLYIFPSALQIFSVRKESECEIRLCELWDGKTRAKCSKLFAFNFPNLVIIFSCVFSLKCWKFVILSQLFTIFNSFTGVPSHIMVFQEGILVTIRQRRARRTGDSGIQFC